MVNDADREAAEALDDALGFLMDNEREIVLDTLAAHRIAAMIEGARLMRDAAAKVAGAAVDREFSCTWGSAFVVDPIRALDPATVIKEAE